jgi:hypothetical protein
VYPRVRGAERELFKHWSPVVRELGLAVTFTDLNFARVQDQFDDKDNIKDLATYNERAKAFLDELVWMSTALRWGRTNLNRPKN